MGECTARGTAHPPPWVGGSAATVAPVGTTLIQPPGSLTLLLLPSFLPLSPSDFEDLEDLELLELLDDPDPEDLAPADLRRLPGEFLLSVFFFRASR